MSFPNVYHLRRVADTASKACFICYKPSSSVLITPDNKVLGPISFAIRSSRSLKLLNEEQNRDQKKDGHGLMFAFLGVRTGSTSARSIYKIGISVLHSTIAAGALQLQKPRHDEQETRR